MFLDGTTSESFHFLIVRWSHRSLVLVLQPLCVLCSSLVLSLASGSLTSWSLSGSKAWKNQPPPMSSLIRQRSSHSFFLSFLPSIPIPRILASSSRSRIFLFSYIAAPSSSTKSNVAYPFTSSTVTWPFLWTFVVFFLVPSLLLSIYIHTHTDTYAYTRHRTPPRSLHTHSRFCCI
ncbi:hypothetical protein BXZ70DRAFT_772238 [Cristinia sonorae]|uniref:Uncharacterized protein n=1 Tax=Cristinia sonorae TaxID=1940300 RepID=A0A8K0XS26_9AGAR|nr:hypothetical protein BXZ70DRAFT_772238 [Cristinia sonorae]